MSDQPASPAPTGAPTVEDRAIELLKNRFPDAFLGEGSHAGQRWAFIKRENVIDALRLLRDQMPFEMLMDETCVDYLGKDQPERFCIVYQLYSMQHNAYFRVKAWVPEDDPVIDTASELWKAAPWAEREIFDMFGITFRGHTDLRRILMPFDYPGHPLRKDYPLTGNGERQNFPRYTR